ncbi:MAG: NAD(P)-dependent oxidoreductase [Sorangiineae bacterium]|nr:NAD(P)-dependent oxidoreductase [Polyangiaceae bacterium]MEB2323106.1 NAD(P)-dependent oxidoreductase [Sorangiineae bacterium]
MRVLVADKLAEDALVEMRSLGVEVAYDPELDAGRLPAALDGVGVLIVRGTEVGAPAIDAARALNLIIRAGSGTGRIDVRAASERGIYVANCPGKNAAAVAELTLALMGSLDRRVPDAIASLRAGKWEKNEYARAAGLSGRALGIAGLGEVGRAVLRAGLALGVEPHAFSRSLTAARAAELGVRRASSLVELASRSRIFTVHLGLNERTRGAVSRQVLEALPDGAIFINTARAELVDYDALTELAPRKGLRVGLDVLPGEPDKREGAYDHPILRAGLVYATPHIGASTDEAQLSISSESVRVLRSFILHGEVPNVVNISASSRGRYQVVVRHRDRVGALAVVLGVLKRHDINIQELGNTVFEGGKAACARILTDTRPSEACLREIMAFDEEVLHVNVVTLPNLA